MPFTLIQCYKQICNALDSKETKDTEKSFLKELKHQFDYILDQRHWFQSSTFSETQSELLAEARAKYLISLEETYAELCSIQKKIKGKPGLVFENLRESIQHQLHVLQKDRMTSRNTSRISLSKSEEKFYSGTDIIFLLANLLGARYFPHQQTSDPLWNNEGICSGDIQQWMDEIKHHGKSISAPRSDLPTTLDQYEQDTNKKKYSIAYRFNYLHITHAWEAIEALSREIKPDFTYYLGIPAHALGIRPITGGEIEFRDSNFGTFVFPNMRTFKIFLYVLISDYYSEYPEYRGHLTLMESAPHSHKKGSEASIPKVTLDTKPFSAKRIKNALPYPCYYIIQAKAAKALLEDHEDKYDEILESRSHHFKSSLKKKLADEIIKEDKAALPRYESTILPDNYHTALIKRTANVLLKEIKRLSLDPRINEKIINEYKELLQNIETARPHLTLISIVDEWLKNKDSPSEFIKKLVRDYEICPAALFVLQERLLSQIADMVNEDWSHLIPLFDSGIKINGKERPRGVANIGELLKSYYQEDNKDFVTLLKSIRYAAKARLWTFRDNDTEIFYELLQNVNPNSPSSLLEVFNSLDYFTTLHLKANSLLTNVKDFFAKILPANNILLSSNRNSLYYKDTKPANTLDPSKQKLSLTIRLSH